MADLRSEALILLMSYPSIIIFPRSNFTKRIMADRRELFPAPVLPTTIALVPVRMVALTPFRAGLASLLYLSHTFSNIILPAYGQSFANFNFSLVPSSSGINDSLDCNDNTIIQASVYCFFQHSMILKRAKHNFIFKHTLIKLTILISDSNLGRFLFCVKKYSGKLDNAL